MPNITAETNFDPDKTLEDMIGIAAYLENHDSKTHYHRKGQFLFSKSGHLNLTIDRKTFSLNSNYVTWIPPYIEHSVRIYQGAAYRSIYIDSALCRDLPKNFSIYSASDLLAALIDRICMACFDNTPVKESYIHLKNIFFNEVQLLSLIHLNFIQYPEDRRLSCLKSIQQMPTLHQLAHKVGACEKTISRIFMKETGMNYSSWKKDWLIYHATTMLYQQATIADIAYKLGFSSTSSFTTFFKKQLGYTPLEYKKKCCFF